MESSQGDALKCLEVSSSLALTKYPELQEVRFGFGVHKVGPKTSCKYRVKWHLLPIYKAIYRGPITPFITGRGPTWHEGFLLVSGGAFHVGVDVYLYLWHVSYSSHVFY